MKITDVQVIPFRFSRVEYANGNLLPERTVVQTVTKVVTDEGAEGYYIGGHGHGDGDGLTHDEIAIMTSRIKSLVVGQDAFDREKFWHWLWVAKFPENLISVLDMALWDLQARYYDVPVYKLLGGCRDKVKAYASTYLNMGSVENYAQFAVQCQQRGYTHYKIHPYYFFDPVTKQLAPGRPSHIKQDLEICRAVRASVGDAMVLSFDPWGTYRTYEEALLVGRELERLGFYWFEHPMSEYQVAPYIKLCRELDIPVLAPEIAEGSVYTRADWILRGASDMSRIDVLRGGITGVKKMVSICEAFGIKCEIHMSGFGNLQILGATSEDTCEYYERGLLAPELDYEAPPPYLKELGDPMDDQGFVHIPQEPGLGYKIDWDYIEEYTIDSDK